MKSLHFTPSVPLGANSTSVLAGVSCLFDASCIIFLGFQLLEMHTSITMRQLFLGYGVLAAVLCGSLSMLWGRYEPWLPTSDQVEPVSGSYDVGPLDTLPLFEQLKTPEFFCILIYATINLTRANMYIGRCVIFSARSSVHVTRRAMCTIILVHPGVTMFYLQAHRTFSFYILVTLEPTQKCSQSFFLVALYSCL